MIIVGGWVRMSPDERDLYLEERLQKIRWVRTRPGCVEYSLSSDPLEDDKVRVFEVWESSEAQDARSRDEEARQPAPHYAVRLKGKSLTWYEVAGLRR
jgi:quinol monooxygenase YgiN